MSGAARVVLLLLVGVLVAGLAPAGAAGPELPEDSAQLAPSEAPTIVGVRRLERTLTADPGAWNPSATSYRYQWLRAGKPVAGATKKTYRLKLADFGQHLQVRVSARRVGYAEGAATTTRTAPIDHRVAVRKTFTYRIATRGRITADRARFQTLAEQSFADPRGWRAAGFAFRRVAKGGSFTLVLASAGTVPSFGAVCSSTWSCRVGRYVIINQTRWQHASPAWNAAGLALRDYRHMVINHETGHWLGHGHARCPGKGRPAPVMLTQSKGLGGCRFNPFPLPAERWSNR